MKNQIDINKLIQGLRLRISDLEYELMIRDLMVEALNEELDSLQPKEEGSKDDDDE